MKIIGFNHFQLDSFDVEKTREFYEALGGKTIRVLEREGGWRGYHVQLAEGAVIEIQPPRLPELCGGHDGWDHLALNVNSCAGACDLITAKGGHVEKVPTPNKLGTEPILNAVTYGPQGEKIEVIQLLSEKEKKSAEFLGVSHIQLNSSDPARSREFYLKAFGGKVLFDIMSKDGSAVKGYMTELVPGSVIEIQPPRFEKTGKNSAWNTIAIETDDINTACAQIEAAGGRKEVGPMKGTMGDTKILNAVIIGPDEEHIELIQLV